MIGLRASGPGLCARAALTGTLLASALAGPGPSAFAYVAVGETIDDVELPALDGGSRWLLGDESAAVFLFIDPGQEHSRDALRDLGRLATELSSKPVRWTAIVSDRDPPEQVRAVVADDGIAISVVVDPGDSLLGRLGVPLHPVVGITDRQHVLRAYEPFRKVNYAAVVRARILHVLGEISDEQLAEALDPPRQVRGGNEARARRNLQLARRMFDAGKHDPARRIAVRSIELDPSLAEAHVLMGEILVALGDCPRAVESFERALALAPDLAEAVSGRETCVSGAGGRKGTDGRGGTSSPIERP